MPRTTRNSLKATLCERDGTLTSGSGGLLALETPIPAIRRVPLEILGMIAGFLRVFLPGSLNDTLYLYSFIRVSRTWLDAGLPVLYGKLDFHRIADRMRFLDILNHLISVNGPLTNERHYEIDAFRPKLELVRELNASAGINTEHLGRFHNLRKLWISITGQLWFEPRFDAISRLPNFTELDINLGEFTGAMLHNVTALPDRVRSIHIRLDKWGLWRPRPTDPEATQYRVIRKVCTWAPGLKDLYLEYPLHFFPALVPTDDWNRVIPKLRSLTFYDEVVWEEFLALDGVDLDLLELEKLHFACDAPEDKLPIVDLAYTPDLLIYDTGRTGHVWTRQALALLTAVKRPVKRIQLTRFVCNIPDESLVVVRGALDAGKVGQLILDIVGDEPEFENNQAEIDFWRSLSNVSPADHPDDLIHFVYDHSVAKAIKGGTNRS